LCKRVKWFKIEKDTRRQDVDLKNLTLSAGNYVKNCNPSKLYASVLYFLTIGLQSEFPPSPYRKLIHGYCILCTVRAIHFVDVPLHQLVFRVNNIKAEENCFDVK
jgi:hypothetical protein